MSREIPFWRQFSFHALLFISELNARKIAAIFATVFISAGVISTLSRGGILALMLALAITLLLYGMARRPSFSGFIFLPMFALAILIAGWVGFAEQALKRFETSDLESGSGRFEHWQETWPAIADMGALGSGIGSYASVHRLYRVTHEVRIFNFGESQFYQTLVEMGWPGLIILLTSWVLVFYCSAHALWAGNSPVTIGLGVAGVFVCSSQMTTAAFDFGLYQASNMIGVAAVVGMLSYNAQALSGRLKQFSWLQFTVPNTFNQLIGLALFAGVFVAGLELHNRAGIDAAREISPLRFSLNNPDIETTERLIAKLRPSVKRAPVKRGLNYLAQLYVHRMRLQYFALLWREMNVSSESMIDEEKTQIRKDLWALTSTDYLHANIIALKKESSLLAARAFQQRDFIQENLQYAVNALHLSRRSSILQPEVHVELTKLYAVLGADNLAQQHAKIAGQLAPGNASIHKIAAVYFLQNGNAENAAPFVKRYLELTPHKLKEISQLLNGNSLRKIDKVSPAIVIERFLPDNPQTIYDYASRNLTAGSEAHSNALIRATGLLGDISPADHSAMVLSGRITLARGLKEEALKQFKAALVSRPSSFSVQSAIVSLLNDLGRHREAVSRLEELIERDYLNSKKYKRLLDRTNKLIN